MTGRSMMSNGSREPIRDDSVPALITAIQEYLAHYNQAPRRFIWTKDADMILAKIAKCPKASNA